MTMTIAVRPVLNPGQPPWDGHTFTPGKTYAARKGAGTTYEVTDDLGHTRVILLDVPTCSHLMYAYSVPSGRHRFIQQRSVGRFERVPEREPRNELEAQAVLARQS
jgi:hypothetical protein